MERTQTRIKLIDACDLCQEALDAARTMAQDFTDGYFGKELELNQENAYLLLCSYDEHKIRANILNDYIHKAEEYLKTISLLADQESSAEK